ncbi:MAG: DUF5655 domain-containing protein [Hyphomicrobium sp.]|uniref:DUF5655 domain-containing protein n=1 Tax=Hyphomicrobium sp. TaxID=82 RepID=UPI003D0E4533
MSIDYGDMERQFLATLKADSGRALDEWMAAIAAQGLTHRNDIIDWLRRQGFMWSKASWLERIHNNGGKPIYGDAAAGARPAPRPRRAAPRPRPTMPPPASAHPPVSAPAPAPPPAPVATAPIADQAGLDALLARAKAYRPLAVFIIAEIRKQVPDAAVTAHDGHVAFRRNAADFALLVVSAKELRLALALAGPPRDATLAPAKLAGLRGAPAMTHMAVLTDARQVTPPLLASIAQAAAGT